MRLSVDVKEGQKLWDAAAQHLALHGLSQDDIEACIGPRLDISVADCLRTLLSALEIAGCEIQDLSVAARPEMLEGLGAEGLRSLMAELTQSLDAQGTRPFWLTDD